MCSTIQAQERMDGIFARQARMEDFGGRERMEAEIERANQKSALVKWRSDVSALKRRRVWLGRCGLHQPKHWHQHTTEAPKRLSEAPIDLSLS